MAFSFKYYSDAGLVNAITQIQGRNLADDVTPANANDHVVYIGSTETGKKARATSNPGTEPIEMSISYAVQAWSGGLAVVGPAPPARGTIVMPSAQQQ